MCNLLSYAGATVENTLHFKGVSPLGQTVDLGERRSSG
jgi:hypothetical protein